MQPNVEQNDCAVKALYQRESAASIAEALKITEGRLAALSECDVPFVAQPRSLAEVGVSGDLIAELVVKQIYSAGRLTATDLSEALAVDYSIIHNALDALTREALIQRVGSQGPLEQLDIFSLTDRGRDHAERALSRSQYRGPVPVPLDQYRKVVREQSLHNHVVSREELQQGLSHLVLDQKTLGVLGPALNSGHSIFFYGPPGNGKTTIAISLGRLLGRLELIPHALYVAGQIIRIFDPVIHQVAEAPGASGGSLDGLQQPYRNPEAAPDRRWVICHRPTVVAGGELTMERLELRYDAQLGYHQAPLQVKANGGVLLIDDFGRQRIPPRDLLNRWIVPMDRGVDYLTLHTGETIQVPFDLLLIFGTNLRPAELVDEAFLRRVRYKILIPNPKEEEFREILRRAAARKNLVIDEGLIDYFIDRYYREPAREMRASHPWDIIAYVDDMCRFEGSPTHLDRETLDLAADSMF